VRGRQAPDRMVGHPAAGCGPCPTVWHFPKPPGGSM
jgi:hypothetical protein